MPNSTHSTAAVYLSLMFMEFINSFLARINVTIFPQNSSFTCLRCVQEEAVFKLQDQTEEFCYLRDAVDSVPTSSKSSESAQSARAKSGGAVRAGKVS